jgi:hypothetical protein
VSEPTGEQSGTREEINRLQVNGASGSGKTSLVRALLARRNVSRRLILDVEDEYENEADIVCYDRRELHDRLSDLGPDHDFYVRYVPPEPPASFSPDEVLAKMGEEAGHLSQWAMSLQDCVIVIDEAHESCHRNCMDARTLRMVKKGRKRGVFAWVASQRPYDVDISLRAELTAVESWTLLLVEENDLDVARSRRGPEFSERVARLPLLHALRLTPHLVEAEEWKIEFRGKGSPLIRRISGITE